LNGFPASEHSVPGISNEQKWAGKQNSLPHMLASTVTKTVCDGVKKAWTLY